MGAPPRLDGAQIYAHFEQVLETWGEDATFQVEWELPSQAGNVSVVDKALTTPVSTQPELERDPPDGEAGQGTLLPA